MSGSGRARCHRCCGEECERVEDAPDEDAVMETFTGPVVRLDYRCAGCGEVAALVPPGRDEQYLTRG